MIGGKHLIKKLVLPVILAGCLAGMALFHGQRILRPLADQLVSPNHQTRHFAYRRFNKLNSTKRSLMVDPLLVHARNSDPFVRRLSLYALRQIEPKDEKIVISFLKGIKDPSKMVRDEAVITLTNLGPSILLRIFDLYEDLEKDTEKQLTESLLQLGDMLLPPLKKGLKEETLKRRLYSAFFLWKLGLLAKEAEPNLRNTLSDPNQEIRLFCALSLNQIDSTDDVVVPIFTESLKAPIWKEYHYETLNRLAKFSKKAKRSIPILIDVFEKGKDGFGEGPYKKPLIAKALSEINPRYTSPQGLSRDLKHKKVLYRYRAAWTMGQEEPPNSAFLSALVDALEEQDPAVLGRVVYALSRIELRKSTRFNRKLIPSLLLTMENPLNQQEIEGYLDMTAHTLASLGSACLSPIMDHLQKDKISFWTAYLVLSKLDKTFIPSLRPYLDYGNSDIRLLAALFLADQQISNPKIKVELNRGAYHEDGKIQKEARKRIHSLKMDTSDNGK
ncbi:hypothetical protein BVX98_06390 [bacterium F11]|nr:hypothetical protein BVX98_06390 [bacterium F11]